jgi:hypothetical protein
MNDPKVSTDSGPRERLKAEIVAGDRSGRRGQWCARKAHLLARAYEEAGGGDTTEERSEAAGRLVEWTDAEWTTRDGEPAIRADETARYPPKEAWQRSPPAQHRATDVRKREGSRTGE